MLKDILERLKKNGKKVDGLGEDALATVGAILEEVVTPIQTELKAAKDALTAATTKNTELETKVAELVKAPPTGTPPKKDDKKDEADPVLASIGTLTETVKSLQARLDGRDKSESVSRVVTDTINAKFGNHRMKAQLIEDATAAGYTKPEEVIAFVERRNKQLVDSGIVKAEQLVAEPTTEGAKTPERKAADEKAEEAKRIEAISAIKPVGRI